MALLRLFIPDQRLLIPFGTRLNQPTSIAEFIIRQPIGVSIALRTMPEVPYLGLGIGIGLGLGLVYGFRHSQSRFLLL